METNGSESGGQVEPSAVDARIALQAAEAEMWSTQNRGLPLWMSALAAVISFGLGTITLANPTDERVTLVSMCFLGALSLTLTILMVKYAWFPPGYRKVKIAWMPWVAAIAIVLIASAAVLVATKTVGESGFRISAAWFFTIGGLSLLPILLDAAEKHWPKRKGRHSA